MKRYEIINHGYTSSDYFQGCGTYGTKFLHCVTGAGFSAVEAYRDACEQVWQSGLSDAETKSLKLPSRPRNEGITARNRVPASYNKSDFADTYWYVSIRFFPK